MLMTRTHYLLTRFNVGVYGGRNMIGQRLRHTTRTYIRYRLELFERYCMPSVDAQTFRDFTWVVLFDSKTPASVRNAITKHNRDRLRYIPLFCKVKQGCGNIEARWRKSIIQEDSGWVVPGLPTALADYVGGQTRTDMIVTTRFDADDVLGRHFMETLSARNSKTTEFLNIPHGFNYDIRNGGIETKRHISGPFLSLAEPWGDSVNTVLCCAHWTRKPCTPLTFAAKPPLIQLAVGKRLWVHVRHKTNWRKHAVVPTNDAAMNDATGSGEFGNIL